MLRRILILGLLACSTLCPAARADEVLDSGPDYMVVAMNPNAGGAVIVRYDFGPYHVVATLLDVWAPPGVAYTVTRNGGVDKAVEVSYESAQFRSKFSALVKPGKTVVDYGEIKRR